MSTRTVSMRAGDRVLRSLVVGAVCPADGMPLYATIVGPRCPLCGAATPR